jgi:predicted RNase H-like HicB family nuclease
MVAQGKTPQAAKKNLVETLRTYLKELLIQGQPLPIESKMVELVGVPVT